MGGGGGGRRGARSVEPGGGGGGGGGLTPTHPMPGTEQRDRMVMSKHQTAEDKRVAASSQRALCLAVASGRKPSTVSNSHLTNLSDCLSTPGDLRHAQVSSAFNSSDENPSVSGRGTVFTSKWSLPSIPYSVSIMTIAHVKIIV